ncbi:membrane protein [Streptomyces cellostaticus]|nr:membrane protein [Streptomyces cellostaticus]
MASRARRNVVSVMGKQRGGVQVFRITGARTGLAEDVRGRQRRYVISMTIRTASVILAATLWNVERYVAIVALVLGALLPYVAVVIANAGRERPPDLPSTFVEAPMRPMIAPPRAEEEAARAESVPEDVPPDPAAGVPGERPNRT